MRVSPDDLKLRFIPASAGNTSQPRLSHELRTVHPRERGEHFFEVDYLEQYYGSSPRARGTLQLVALFVLVRRFIPASAGNTSQLALLD